MHSVSGAIRGILVLNKIKYPIASEGLRPPDPLFQRFNIDGSPLSKSQICPLSVTTIYWHPYCNMKKVLL